MFNKVLEMKQFQKLYFNDLKRFKIFKQKNLVYYKRQF